MNRKVHFILLALVILTAGIMTACSSTDFGSGGVIELQPKDGVVSIPVKHISDGKAHYFKVKAADNVMVTFFVLKSKDGVIRAAVDACDVCYKAGKGYIQEGDFMVCENCGQKFASNRINDVKGGCNPAPLERKVENNELLIAYNQINTNSWYCQFKK